MKTKKVATRDFGIGPSKDTKHDERLMAGRVSWNTVELIVK